MSDINNPVNFEVLICKLSSEFINLSTDEVDNKIESGLELISDILGIERIALLQFSEDNKKLHLTHSFANDPQKNAPTFIVSDSLPWFAGSIKNGKILRISKLDDIPVEAIPERQYANKQGLKAFLTAPLKISGSIIGGISYSTLTHERTWGDEVVQRIILVNEIFANALDRSKKEEKLKRAYSRIKNLQEQLEQENFYLRQEIKLSHNHEEIIGSSNAILHALHQAEQVAITDSTVLVLGETGTGKELLARVIHRTSSRASRTMIKVNCAALPPTLIEGELFGREKGAYTGALTREVGRFELADKSTLFLDEISELPFELQAKLLRVLQEGQFERLGNAKTISVNVRIIAATNRNLASMVKEGTFRKDLYYRLNVFPITVPPLRVRTEDIPALVWHFVKELESTMAKRFESVPNKKFQALQDYPWPGNIRELRNVVEQAMILSSGKVLEVSPPNFQEAINYNSIQLDDIIRNHILEVLDTTGWRISGKNGAAELLGVKPTTLQSKLNKLGIQRP
jgi:formate hydrogenlyase transcriptional activator